MIDLSIITINYKTPELLGDLLSSLNAVRKADELDFEVVVVNVTPEDGSEALVNEKFTWVKQIVDTRNLGFSGNNNIGLKEASGRYILFLNSDTTVPRGTLSEMVNFMDSHSTSFSKPDCKEGVRNQDKPLGAATCYVELASGGMDPDCHRGFPTPWASFTYFLGLEKLFPYSRLFGQYHQFYKDLNKTHEIDACAGAFLLLPSKVGKEIDLRNSKSNKNKEFFVSSEGNSKSESASRRTNPKQIQNSNVQNSKPQRKFNHRNSFCHLGFCHLMLFRVSNFVLRICGRSCPSDRDKKNSFFKKEKPKNSNAQRPLWWDEDFFFYGEDLDLCWRIKEAGYKVMFYPHVKIIHHKGGSSGIREESKDVTKATDETKKRILPETTRAMRLFYQKHFEEKYHWIVNKFVYFGIKILETLRLHIS